jgi:hypothetical protein
MKEELALAPFPSPRTRALTGLGEQAMRVVAIGSTKRTPSFGHQPINRSTGLTRASPWIAPVRAAVAEGGRLHPDGVGSASGKSVAGPVEPRVLLVCESCGAERSLSQRQLRRRVKQGVPFVCRPCRFGARRLAVWRRPCLDASPTLSALLRSGDGTAGAKCPIRAQTSRNGSAQASGPGEENGSTMPLPATRRQSVPLP